MKMREPCVPWSPAPENISGAHVELRREAETVMHLFRIQAERPSHVLGRERRRGIAYQRIRLTLCQFHTLMANGGNLQTAYPVP